MFSSTMTNQPTPSAADGRKATATHEPARALDFEGVYVEHFDFVWRSIRRLGVAECAAEDVAQEVFVIVHRRLESYEGRSSVRGWLFGIVRGVVANHRRSLRRSRVEAGNDGSETPDVAIGARPQARVEKAEAVRTLYQLLDELDGDKREVFVLAELEQLAVPEIAVALGCNVNTTYARLRAARAQFKSAVARHRARDEWRVR
jgi:RNA polymerase sigma-70 factor (ECF subfamily)